MCAEQTRIILEKFVRLCLENHLHINRENVFDSFWRDDDYEWIISNMITCLMKNYGIAYSSVGEKILKRRSENRLISERQDDWLMRFIGSNYKNQSAMEFLFHITCNLSNEQHLLAIKTFCNFNQSMTAFKKIPLWAQCWSWSNSEVPIIQQQIKFIQSIKSELMGVEFIEHREYLSQRINVLTRYIGEIQEREFLER